MTQSNRTRTSLLAVLFAAAALAACDRQEDNRTAGEKVDSTVAQADSALERAGDKTREAGAEASGAVSDAMITTAVNAELAKDSQLSALKIDVDTANGKVALKGTAPSAEAKSRATQLASAVKGVVAVDNQLTVSNS